MPALSPETAPRSSTLEEWVVHVGLGVTGVMGVAVGIVEVRPAVLTLGGIAFLGAARGIVTLLRHRRVR